MIKAAIEATHAVVADCQLLILDHERSPFEGIAIVKALGDAGDTYLFRVFNGLGWRAILRRICNANIAMRQTAENDLTGNRS
ncbi:hypothetical protein [Rhodanobacter ginsengiterrae]|uniref:hypothetical protein n=1 Tax=Rhodanobacter ginsengiterrae TaxID=2008451 RepID=UPI003CF6A1A0